jgi:hypothetical protein
MICAFAFFFCKRKNSTKELTILDKRVQYAPTRKPFSDRKRAFAFHKSLSKKSLSKSGAKGMIYVIIIGV